ncbi:MAG: DedA family protein [Amaricoccus sp.]|uniref:DedA family protein n=1 Tax=Amaricoccus sp. TaxID=1872485 RepID=UPI0039E723B1
MFESFVQSVIEFVSTHREWAWALAFAFAFLETVAFVSLFIPSTVILAGVGTLIAADALEFWPIWVGASAGALVGSTLSFAIGRRFGPAVFAAWPLNRDPALVDRGRAAFARWGTPAVLAAHFIGPLRSVAFILAGASAMRLLAFQLANVPGALAWAYLTPKSGEIGGALLGSLWRTLTGGA